MKGNWLGRRAQGYSIVHVSVPLHVYNQKQMSRSAGLGCVNTSRWPLLETSPFQERIEGRECGEQEKLSLLPPIPQPGGQGQKGGVVGITEWFGMERS